MSVKINVPEVGESISEVTIGSWLKQDGDFVEMDEPIAELESDKATFELTAEAAGKLIIKAQEGDTLNVGDLICEIDSNASDGSGDKPDKGVEKKDQKEEKEEKQEAKSDGEPKKTGKVKEMTVPEVGESISEVTISSWIKSDGDYVELDEIIAEVESDKATFELPAEANGILQIVAQEGDTLGIGDLICKIEETEGKPAKEKEAVTETDKKQRESKQKESKDAEKNYAEAHASPAAAKILAEKDIDPKEVNGTGKDGRITKEDALKAEKTKADGAPAKEKAKEEAATPPSERNQRRKKLSSLRKTIAKRLVAVKNETAMLTTFNEVDMKPIMDLRKKYKESFKEKYGVGLGFMSFFTKACCMALQEWEAVNAYIDGDEIVYNDYCDISIAVSTDRGLVVPVIRNAESLSFHEIESKIIELATKARENKITIEEMTGGTFTITNGGIFGSMLSTPIINSPQSGILGMHNIVERPVVVDGEVTVRPIMFVALSYDHRIVDGRESVSFLVRLKQLLEDPNRLLIGI